MVMLYPPPYMHPLANLIPIMAAMWWFKLPEFIGLTTNHWQEEYDYVIVGGGAAGAVLANRLSEDHSKTVLLLEAGDVENIYSEVPAVAGSLQGTPMDWAFLTTPQKNSCLGRINRQCRFARGRVLGGSTILNTMLYVRGNPRDYDLWEEMGNKGWGWDNVLPYFLKSENNQNHKFAASPLHATGGPLNVEDARFVTPLVPAFIKAGKYFGYDEVDVNGPQQTGTVVPQKTQLNGVRYSSARAFLVPVKDRKNLDIVTNAYVTNIIFDKHKRARIVQFDRKKETHVVHVRKEVIVAAGGINSPRLLLLSGIGPKEDLEKLGIPVVADLPVGLNLQDHYRSDGLSFTVTKNVTMIPTRLQTVPNAELYFEKGMGPFTMTLPIEAMGFINTKYNKYEDWPDIELFIFPYSPATDGGGYARGTGISLEVMKQVYWPYNNTESFTLAPGLLRPKSRGYVTIRSKDPYDPPVINSNYFSHPDDLRRMVDALKMSIAWASTPPFQAMGARVYHTRFPGCEHMQLWSDEYIECMARVTATTIYHFVGTTKMGDPHDPTTVVDPKLRVLGVKGLRVVCEAIMPHIVSGNTYAPTLMIAEKASDMIKEANN